MRTLALDWGTVRIGAAVSDPDGKIAFPLDKFIESKNGVAEIKKIVDELEVEKILLGQPKNLSGGDTQTTDLVEKFRQDLGLEVPCPIEYIDERFSSVGAAKTLGNQGLKEKSQRGLVDNLAAQQLLQSYLDAKRN